MKIKMPEVYSPSDDSYLMSKVLKRELPTLLKKNPDLKFLEIGTGSGINLQAAENSGMKKENIFSCDINPEAVKHCRKLKFKCIKSNLFSNIDGKYSLIIFNPPYLPDDKHEPKSSRIATTGGKRGDEIILKFLKQAKKHLKPEAEIFLLTSSLTLMSRIKKEFKNYKVKLLEKEKLFFEELMVWGLR